MGISTQTLMKERFSLKKTFNELNNRIKSVEGDVAGMKANLSAVHGALQEIEKLINYDEQYGNKDASKEPDIDKVDIKPALDIKPKEQPQQLNEGDK